MTVVTFTTGHAVHRKVVVVFLAKKLMVVSCRVTLGAVFLLKGIVPLSTVDPSYHVRIILLQIARTGPAGGPATASGG
jgi:hypothetical protein